jgi:hypothetical protein
MANKRTISRIFFKGATCRRNQQDYQSRVNAEHETSLPSFFHRDWLPIFRGRIETPLSNCFNGVHIQTCVETLDDWGFIHAAICVNYNAQQNAPQSSPLPLWPCIRVEGHT